MYEKRVKEMFDRIDAKDVEGFLTYLTEDVKFRFGNEPQVSNSANVRETTKYVYSAIGGLRHAIVAMWEFDNTVIVKLEVEYERLSGSKVTLPCANIFEFREGRIADYRVYMDIGPAFA